MSEVTVKFHWRLGYRGEEPEESAPSQAQREFGEYIAELRNAKGLDINSFASGLELTPAAISKLESGKMAPNKKLVRKIVKCVKPLVEERVKLQKLARHFHNAGATDG